MVKIIAFPLETFRLAGYIAGKETSNGKEMRENGMKFTTDYDILNGAKDRDEAAWEQFYNFYAPLIRLHGRDCGLKNENLEDLIQNVMITLSAQMPNFVYDPAKGRFRDYLRKIIRARANDMLRKIYRQERIPCEEISEAETEDQFEEEWREHILTRSMEKLKESVSLHHYQIFYLLEIRHYKVKELAELYHVPPISIYTIRNRLETRLKKIVRELDC